MRSGGTVTGASTLLTHWKVHKINVLGPTEWKADWPDMLSVVQVIMGSYTKNSGRKNRAIDLILLSP